VWNGVSWVRSYQDSRDSLRIKTITSNTYTIGVNDLNGVLLRFTSNDPVNVLIPNVTSIPINSSLMISQEGNGVIILLGLDGVSVLSPETIFSNKKHGKVTLIKTGSNVWELEGNLKENPEYLIAANRSVVTRGTTVLFSIEAEDAELETLFWTVETVSGEIKDSDFLSPSNAVTVGGQVLVTNEVGALSISIAESDDFIEEISFKVNLRLGSNIGPIVASSQVITIPENYFIGVGDLSTGIATSNGLWVVGLNDEGQLGLGNIEDVFYASLVDSTVKIKYFSSSELCSAIIKEDGTLWTSGDNEDGQLGLGDTTPRDIFTQVGTDTDWKSVSCGTWHMVAQKNDGSLWAWGAEWTSALGLGVLTENVLTPSRIGDDTDWKEYLTGGWQTVAIKNNGTLWAWGSPWSGATGQGDTTTYIYVPTQVGTSTNWRSLAKQDCWETIAAIQNDGSLWMWGANWFGNCGTGDDVDVTVPTLIDQGPWKMICATESNTIGIKEDGSLWGWGDNRLAQLGLGYTNNDPVFALTRIGPENNWSRLRTSWYTVTSIKKDGTLWTWGECFGTPLSYLTDIILYPVEFTIPDFLPTKTEL
jgi:alpha-tubulin suppressor-like RCC1 family protein